MFDFSLGELSLVIIIGLIVLGPRQLVDTIKTVKKWLHALRKVVQSIENEVNNELQLQELNESIKKVTELNLQHPAADLSKELEELKLHALSLENSFKNQQMVSHKSHQIDEDKTSTQQTVIDQKEQKSPPL